MSASLRVGVLALQGSFREHMALLNRCEGVTALEVRSKEELASVSGLIIPGGESTTMALVAERWGLIPELRAFAAAGKPIWGTCAGMIFIAERAEGMKEGGQGLLGGLDIKVSRNFFGAQAKSFEANLKSPEPLLEAGSGDTFRALFIRAPAVLEMGPEVECLGEYELSEEERQSMGKDKVVVAVRQGVLMATAFHPELTSDKRWHQMFVNMIRKHATAVAAAEAGIETTVCVAGRAPNRPTDMPVYAQAFMQTEVL